MFGWTKAQVDLKTEEPERELARLEHGSDALEVGTTDAPFLIPTPTELCTGAETEESASHTLVRVHLDEQTLNVAKAQLPVEELFAAEVSKSHFSLSLKATTGEEMDEDEKESHRTRICWGELSVEHDPEKTTWMFKEAFRRQPPEKAGIIRPAYYNPVLEVMLQKKVAALTGQPAFAKMECQSMSLPREVPYSDSTKKDLRFDPVKHAADLRKVRGEDDVQELELATGQPTQKGRRGPRKAVTRLTVKQDEAKAMLALYINDKIADDPKAFSVRLRDTSLQLVCHAAGTSGPDGRPEGIDYVMFGGSFGGRCKPDKSTWKCERKENGGPLVMEIVVVKAWKQRWESVFEPRWDN